MTSRGRLVVTAFLLTLAGCSGLGGGEAPHASVTPAPVPEVTDTGPRWLGQDGAVRAERLGTSHGAVLNRTGYTVSSNRTVTYPNGSVHSQLRVRVAVATDRTYRAEVTVRGPDGPVFLGRPPANATFWSDGDRFIRRLSRANRTVYNEYRPPDSYAGTWQFWVHTVALDGDPGRDVASTFDGFAPTARPRSPSEGSLYRAVGDRPTGGDFVDNESDIPAAENATLAALIEPRGFVRSYRVDYEIPRDEDRLFVTRRVRYEAVGETTVPRPEWYDRAVDE